VEHRQRVVLHEAAQTGNIVSSLFPSGVREKMLANTENIRGRKLRSSDKSSCVTTNPNDLHGMDLATYYPATTVLFQDLSGFTAWSSTRSPNEVFILLETLYRAFDAVAKRRKVFKVDCYVAAAGIPNFVKDHAVRMAKFAVDCLEQASLVTLQLTTQLGPETADLNLRIGINSGPTTAGGKYVVLISQDIMCL
jgi:class 3 adenylate cyclase